MLTKISVALPKTLPYASLTILQKKKAETVKGKQIRACMYVYHHPKKLTPLVTWTKALNLTNIKWEVVLSNIYSISRNFKLVQLQYKLIMRISTCKYMRHKMNICPSNLCSFCHVQLETGNLRTYFSKIPRYPVVYIMFKPLYKIKNIFEL